MDKTKDKKEPTKKEPGTKLAPRSSGADLAGAEVSTHLPTVATAAPIAQQQAPLLTRSERIDKIASALSCAQAEFVTVKKNSEVDFMSKRTGERVHYKYADLASVVESARPVLAKHKLSMSQMPVRCKGGVHITTMLMHTSGQFLQSTLSLEVTSNDVKEVGTVITYGRRYALASILGIVTDDDLDAPPRKDEKPLTKEGQKISRLCGRLYTVGAKAGGNHDIVLDWLKKRYGIKKSSKEMNEAQLEEAIKILDKKAKDRKTYRGKQSEKGSGNGQKKTA